MNRFPTTPRRRIDEHPDASDASKDVVTVKDKKSAKPEGSGTGPALILVVDDFADNRAMYAEYLAFSGFAVVEAANGLEAIEKASELQPDLIVMDLALPIMDGWEATRRLKQDPRTRHIPIVALTGHALDSHSKRARDAGCDDFIVKPCLPQALLSKANELLERARGSRRRLR